MTDRLDIYTRTTSLKLPKDEEEGRKIRQLVYQTNRDDDTPFERLVDFWFAAVAWAALKTLPLPEDTSGGKEFVKLGTGDKDIRLDEWQLTVIQALYLNEQDALDADPLDFSKIDTQGGKMNKGAPVGASAPIEVANRYALAGATALRESITKTEDDPTKAIRQVSAVASFKKEWKKATEGFAKAFE